MHIYLSEKAFDKVRSFNKLADTKEWLGICVGGKNEEIKDGVFVEDIFLPYQEVSSTTCEVDVEKFSNELAQINNRDNTFFQKCIGWIHSHNNMETFYSSTDTTTDSDLVRYFDNNKVIISIIVNNENNIIGKVHLKIPYGNIEFNANVLIYRKFDESNISNYIKGLFAKKVVEKVYTSNVCTSVYHSSDYELIPKYKILSKEQIEEIIMIEKKIWNLADLKNENKELAKRNKLKRRIRNAMIECLTRLYSKDVSFWSGNANNIYEFFQRGFKKPNKKEEDKETQTSFSQNPLHKKSEEESIEEEEQEALKSAQDTIEEERELWKQRNNSVDLRDKSYVRAKKYILRGFGLDEYEERMSKEEYNDILDNMIED